MSVGLAPEERDDLTCSEIVAKFDSLAGKTLGGGGGVGVGYSEVARRAWEIGRSALATKVFHSHSPLTFGFGCSTQWYSS